MQKTFYLLIAGPRDYTDYQTFCQVADYILQEKVSQGYIIEIVSGGAKGADKMAEKYAKERGFLLTVMEADWKSYGNMAGHIRNREMHKYINTKKERGCLCFWSTKNRSRGTRGNFELALVKKIQIAVYDIATERFLTQEEIWNYR